MTMLGCMVWALVVNEDFGYSPYISHSFAVFVVKIPCTIALHLVLFPEVANGMIIMKFANNQAKLFVEGGSEIAFFIGFMQYMMAILCETINIYMLSY